VMKKSSIYVLLLGWQIQFCICILKNYSSVYYNIFTSIQQLQNYSSVYFNIWI
jgi:hypothetical protein